MTRLFVAVWPDGSTRQALSAVISSVSGSDLRWVAPEDWHLTLAFLGSVPDHESDELIKALRDVGPVLAPAMASMGPETLILGKAVLCVPVDGLDDVATTVRAATDRFNRAPDRERSFFGHVTLARAARGRRVPMGASGIAVTSVWPVSTVGLVASVPNGQGSRYSVRQTVALEA